MTNSSESIDVLGHCSELTPPSTASAGPIHDETRFYGYIPSLAVTVVFTMLFSISTRE
jgi:hypothetical protein